MPSLIGTTVTANYLKTQPTTRFGTRELAVVVLEVAGIGTNQNDANSLFTRAIRAIQQNVEVFGVFDPSGNFCTILVAADTMPQDEGDEAGDGNANSYLGSVLTAAGITGTVWNAEISGDNINYD
jgi:hypothetical protein